MSKSESVLYPIHMNKTLLIIAIKSILLLSITLNAQSINKEITGENQTPYLLGKINKAGLQGDNYKAWFSENYTNYQPNTKIINTIKDDLKSYDLLLFMGTWCGDSKKEVPRLYKVLEACNFPTEQLTMVAVSRESSMYKQSPQHEEAGLNIHRVPTLIVYKNGEEVNRIVEHPIDTFEKDIQNIITKNDYKSNYQIVSEVNDILEKKGIKGLKRKRKKLLKKYKNQVSSMFELNTYGKILYTTYKIDEAIAVFDLNTKLFPNEARTFMSLANTLGANGNKEKAIKVLENAIKLHPDNDDLKENLTVVKSH